MYSVFFYFMTVIYAIFFCFHVTIFLLMFYSHSYSHAHHHYLPQPARPIRDTRADGRVDASSLPSDTVHHIPCPRDHRSERNGQRPATAHREPVRYAECVRQHQLGWAAQRRLREPTTATGSSSGARPRACSTAYGHVRTWYERHTRRTG